jgi:hypothetical protein
MRGNAEKPHWWICAWSEICRIWNKFSVPDRPSVARFEACSEMRVRVIGRGLGTGSVWWRCLRLGTWSKNVPPVPVTDRVVVRAS